MMKFQIDPKVESEVRQFVKDWPTLDSHKRERRRNALHTALLEAGVFEHLRQWVASRARNAADAEDIMQELQLQVVKSLHRFQAGNSSLLSWIYGVAKNVRSGVGRKERRHQATMLPYYETKTEDDQGVDASELAAIDAKMRHYSKAAGVTTMMERARQNKVLVKAIEALPLRLLDIVILHAAQGLDWQEVAENIDAWPELDERHARVLRDLIRDLHRTLGAGEPPSDDKQKSLRNLVVDALKEASESPGELVAKLLDTLPKELPALTEDQRKALEALKDVLADQKKVLQNLRKQFSRVMVLLEKSVRRVAQMPKDKREEACRILFPRDLGNQKFRDIGKDLGMGAAEVEDLYTRLRAFEAERNQELESKPAVQALRAALGPAVQGVVEQEWAEITRLAGGRSARCKESQVVEAMVAALSPMQCCALAAHKKLRVEDTESLKAQALALAKTLSDSEEDEDAAEGTRIEAAEGKKKGNKKVKSDAQWLDELEKESKHIWDLLRYSSRTVWPLNTREMRFMVAADLECADYPALAERFKGEGLGIETADDVPDCYRELLGLGD